MKERKILLSFSGGADSASLLFDLYKDYSVGNVILPVYFFYGQKHSPGEKQAIFSILDTLKGKGILPLRVINFDLSQYGRSALTQTEVPVPKQSEGKQGTTVVPFRNSHFILNLATIAVVEGFDTIALGPTKEDLPEYPDCRPEFFSAMQKALRLGDRAHDLTLYTPYVSMWKREVIAEGVKNGVPYGITHTCYNGVYQKPCRECDACKEREASFSANGLTDPLVRNV